MTKEFQFTDEGRTYTCRVEEPRGGRTEAWWWFGVSGDQHRYAPFQAVAEDTQDAVQSRVVAYYRDLLARRAMPVQSRSPWARRAPAVAATPDAPAVDTVDVEAAAQP